MQIVLVSIYLLLFIYFIKKSTFFRVENLPINWPTILFILKVASGVILGLIYTYHYTNTKTTDTWKFFNDSKILFDALPEHPADFFRMITGIGSEAPELRAYYERMDAWLNTNMLFNDNRTIIRINAFFQLFSFGYYYVHVIFMNIFSFTGLFCLFKVFNQLLSKSTKEIFILTFLFPSLMFWGSGLLKDGLLLFALGMFIYFLYETIYRGITFKKSIGLLFSLALLSLTKFYIILLMAPGLLIWWGSHKKKWKTVFSKMALAYILFFFIAFNIHYLFPEYNLSYMLYWKQANFYGFANSVDSKSLIEIPRLGYTAWSIIQHVPNAFATTFFRPFITDIHSNPLVLLSAIENIVIVLLCTLAIIFYQKPKLNDSGFFWMCLFFIFTLYVLIGLTTPVLGATVRYKIPALPFLGFVLLNLTEKRILK